VRRSLRTNRAARLAKVDRTKLVQARLIGYSPRVIASDTQYSEFERTGVLHLPGFLSTDRTLWLEKQVDALVSAREQAGSVWKFYDEEALSRGERILSRIERFTPYCPALRELLLDGPLPRLASTLLSESALLFKDKINLKLPGSSGFLAHQDAQAGWTAYGHTHLTLMVSIDATTVENGCLEVSRGKRRRELSGPEWDPLDTHALDEASFEPLKTAPGDVVAFDSYVVHRSAPNRTERARRVLYATYNPQSQGDCYERYFADKHKNYPPDVERDANRTYRYRV